MSGPRVGVVGATGAVGQEMLDVLHERSFPAGDVRVLASARSVGRKVRFGGQELTVEEATPEVLGELDLALLSAGKAVSRALGPDAARRGCVVVDNSSAFRMDAQVPLVVPEINARDLDGHANLIANPNCSTIVNVMVAGPLHAAFGLRRMVVSTYQAASGAGAAGLDELMAGARGFLDGNEPEPTVFARPLAFNLVPVIGTLSGAGVTDEEEKMTRESRKILGNPDLEVVTTCVRVPVQRAHAVSTCGFFNRDVSPDAARAVLERAPGVIVAELPTPRELAGRDEVAVGRLRPVPFDGPGLAWFAVGDQIRKGAALNAVQIAEVLFA